MYGEERNIGLLNAVANTSYGSGALLSMDPEGALAALNKF